MPALRRDVGDAIRLLGFDPRWVHRVVITPHEIEVTRYKTNERTGRVHYDDGLESETITIPIA